MTAFSFGELARARLVSVHRLTPLQILDLERAVQIDISLAKKPGARVVSVSARLRHAAKAAAKLEQKMRARVERRPLKTPTPGWHPAVGDGVRGDDVSVTNDGSTTTRD